MSADFSFLTLRNLTAYQSNGARVPQNYILTISTNGVGNFTNVISPSSVNASSIITSTLCANIMDVNILSTTVHIGSNIIASTLTLDSYAIIPNIFNSSLLTSTISTNYINANFISTITNFTMQDNSGNTIVMTGQNNDLYINGFPVLTDGNLSSVSSLYWEDDYGQYTLSGGIFNKNLGQGTQKYMVGIGTNSSLNGTLSVKFDGPGTGNAFHVSSNNNVFQIKNISSGIYDYMSGQFYDNQANTFGSALQFFKTQNFNSTVSTCELGYVDFYGLNSSLSTARGAFILAKQTGPVSTFTTTDLQFLTCTSSSGAINMVINSAGRVGVRNTSPQYTLDVNGSIFSNDILHISSATSGANGAIRLFSDSGSSWIESGSTFAVGAGNYLKFGNMYDTLGVAVLTLDMINSRVGIKNETPLFPLDVKGTTQINWSGTANARIGTVTPLEGFALSWNQIAAGGINGQTEVISGSGSGGAGGIDFFVNVADNVAATASNLAARITGTKRMGINNSTPATTLVVNNPTPNSLNGLAVNSADVNTIIGNVNGSNNGSIQVTSGGSASAISATPYNLTLQPLGGTTTVGSGGLTVSGNTSITGNLNVTGTAISRVATAEITSNPGNNLSNWTPYLGKYSFVDGDTVPALTLPNGPQAPPDGTVVVIRNYGSVGSISVSPLSDGSGASILPGKTSSYVYQTVLGAGWYAL